MRSARIGVDTEELLSVDVALTIRTKNGKLGVVAVAVTKGEHMAETGHSRGC